MIPRIRISISLLRKLRCNGPPRTTLASITAKVEWWDQRSIYVELELPVRALPQLRDYAAASHRRMSHCALGHDHCNYEDHFPFRRKHIQVMLTVKFDKQRFCSWLWEQTQLIKYFQEQEVDRPLPSTWQDMRNWRNWTETTETVRIDSEEESGIPGGWSSRRVHGVSLCCALG